MTYSQLLYVYCLFLIADQSACPRLDGQLISRLLNEVSLLWLGGCEWVVHWLFMRVHGLMATTGRGNTAESSRLANTDSVSFPTTSMNNLPSGLPVALLPTHTCFHVCLIFTTQKTPPWASSKKKKKMLCQGDLEKTEDKIRCFWLPRQTVTFDWSIFSDNYSDDIQVAVKADARVNAGFVTPPSTYVFDCWNLFDRVLAQRDKLCKDTSRHCGFTWRACIISQWQFGCVCMFSWVSSCCLKQ